ncbi:MAG: hypothetical protein J7M09_03380 [Deltaproteobacteria bacterium]|nr:hypothetical protein [Candidatus Tharpella sp.]
MKKLLLTAMLLVMVIGLGGFQANPAKAESLYEYYADASAAELEQETKTMGRDLKKTFSQENIHQNQQKIDFATYFTNLKKAILYSAKLSTYSEYHEDLAFARDNEVFKGLPEAPGDLTSDKKLRSRKEFIDEKYERTKTNVEEEIDIYVDLLTLSLDICESMSVNDLSGFVTLEENRNQVVKWLHGDQYAEYQKASNNLAQAWPEIKKRIADQCTIWQGRPASPDAPIISARLVGSL